MTYFNFKYIYLIIVTYDIGALFSDITETSLCIGLARVGSETQKILACSLKDMSQTNLGGPLHSLIIAGPHLHPLELEYLEQFKV